MVIILKKRVVVFDRELLGDLHAIFDVRRDLLQVSVHNLLVSFVEALEKQLELRLHLIVVQRVASVGVRIRRDIIFEFGFSSVESVRYSIITVLFQKVTAICV